MFKYVLTLSLICFVTDGNNTNIAPTLETQWNDKCFNCIMEGNYYCRATNSCYASAVDLNDRDCTNPANFAKATNGIVPLDNRWFNNIFQCPIPGGEYKKNCAYTQNETTQIKVPETNRIIITGENLRSQVPLNDTSRGEDGTYEYPYFERKYQINAGDICEIFIVNTIPTSYLDKEGYAYFNVTQTASQDPILHVNSFIDSDLVYEDFYQGLAPNSTDYVNQFAYYDEQKLGQR